MGFEVGRGAQNNLGAENDLESGPQWGIQWKHDILEGVPLEVEWGVKGLSWA